MEKITTKNGIIKDGGSITMLYIVLYYLGIVLSILFLSLILLFIIKDKPQDIILDLLHIKKPDKKKTKKEPQYKKIKKEKETVHQSPIIIKSGDETAPLIIESLSNEETTLLVHYDTDFQDFIMKENIIIVHTNETISA